MPPLRIKGKRVDLRRLRKADARSISQYANNPNISRYIPPLPHPYVLQHAQDFVSRTQEQLKAGIAYELGIALKRTDAFVGMMSLVHINKGNKNAEIGYWIAEPFWGKGFAFEALDLILDFSFNTLQLSRVYAKVLHPNVPSAKLLERHCFKREGRLRKHIAQNGTMLDELVYGLLKEEHWTHST